MHEYDKYTIDVILLYYATFYSNNYVPESSRYFIYSYCKYKSY